MKIAILQPGYLPWLGFFEQVAKVDKFVLYNDVQYTKRDWRNRNQIKTQHGTTYLTVPVQSSRRGTLIKDKKIHYGDEDWQYNHIANLRHQYGNAPYFNQYFPAIRDIIESDFEFLDDLDTALIKCLTAQLGMDNDKFLRSSKLSYPKSDNAQKNLINICQTLGADKLYNGKSGRSYIDEAFFKKHGIKVQFQHYNHPTYSQLHGDFISHLSIIDLIFNCGDRSLEILNSG